MMCWTMPCNYTHQLRANQTVEVQDIGPEIAGFSIKTATVAVNFWSGILSLGCEWLRFMN